MLLGEVFVLVEDVQIIDASGSWRLQESHHSLESCISEAEICSQVEVPVVGAAQIRLGENVHQTHHLFVSPHHIGEETNIPVEVLLDCNRYLVFLLLLLTGAVIIATEPQVPPQRSHVELSTRVRVVPKQIVIR